MRIGYILFLLFFCKISFSQNSLNSLPVILPSSPELSAIVKNSQLSVGQFTGAANAAIPLYDLKTKNISSPISINYASNGFKVDEIPSRVGLSWILNAGGMISRRVHDKPDESATRQKIPLNFPYTDDSTLTVFRQRDPETPFYDSEPDEYYVNGPGFSTKFIVKDNGEVLQIPHSNLKIQLIGSALISEIIITNTEGLKFYFGGFPVEKTISHSYTGLSGNFSNIITGYFMYKIKAPEGDSILFNYTPISIATKTGVTQTVTRKVSSPADINSCFNNCTVCPANLTANYYENLATSNYFSYYLSSISTSEGVNITMTYEARPDNSGDNRLTDVIISADLFNKKYHLLYDDSPDYGPYTFHPLADYNKRFFLKELQEIFANGSNIDTLKYQFDYGPLLNLPKRLSYAQDHYGYFNGQNNSTLLPAAPGYGIFGVYALANREPDITYKEMGLLKKIQFPTGGSQEFIYGAEPDTVTVKVDTRTQVMIYGIGSDIATPLSYTDNSIVTKRENMATLTFTADENISCIGCTPPEQGLERIIQVRLYNVTTGASTPYFYEEMRVYNTISREVLLEANTNYRLELKVFGEASEGIATLLYDTAAQDYFTQTILAGKNLVVKQLKSTDHVSGKSVNKYFHYAEPNSWYTYEYFQQYYETQLCPPNCGSPADVTAARDFINCGYYSLTSQNIASLYMFDNAYLSYGVVVESDDHLFANGGIEHYYNTDELITIQYLQGDPQLNLPNNIATTKAGYETRTRYFNNVGRTVKDVFNYFRIDETVNIRYASYAINAKNLSMWGFLYEITTDWTRVNVLFNISRYTFISNWIKLDSTVVYEYDIQNNAMKTATSFEYGSPNNVLPIRQQMLDSKLETLSTEFKYPTDFTSSPVYNKMVANNIISPVIEKKNLRNLFQINLSRTVYEDWYPSSSNLILKPKEVYNKIGNYPEEIFSRMFAYDSKGNIRQMAKENDYSISYIWGYNDLYPIAEIKNASIDEVYYNNFEDLDGQVDANSRTGRKSHLGTYSISFTPPANGKTYMLSYWYYSGGSWKFREKPFQSFVSEGEKIDDIKVYPTGTFMTTFTFDRFIGMTSMTNPNDRTVYYEYDSIGRLILVRDHDKNILKRICYTYAGTIGNCNNY